MAFLAVLPNNSQHRCRTKLKQQKTSMVQFCHSIPGPNVSKWEGPSSLDNRFWTFSKCLGLVMTLFCGVRTGRTAGGAVGGGLRGLKQPWRGSTTPPSIRQTGDDFLAKSTKKAACQLLRALWSTCSSVHRPLTVLPTHPDNLAPMNYALIVRTLLPHQSPTCLTRSHALG